MEEHLNSPAVFEPSTKEKHPVLLIGDFDYHRGYARKDGTVVYRCRNTSCDAKAEVKAFQVICHINSTIVMIVHFVSLDLCSLARQ
jgi:hypothetical protein